jgi:rubrerythrin
VVKFDLEVTMQKPNLDSKELTFSNVNEVLNYAINGEREACFFYTEWAKKVTNPGIKKVFEELAVEESGHERFLKDFKEGKIKNLPQGEIVDLKISDYLIESKASIDLNYQDALILAMQRERDAFRLYSHLAEITKENEYKKLFNMLAEQEAKHKLRLELIYDEDILVDN